MTTKKAAHDAPPDAPALTLVADDDEAGLSEAEYFERRREIEARLVRLAVRLITSRKFPAWRYHASEAPQIVATAAAADALGAGWHVRPV